jgi:hypothetical protein
VAVHYAWCLAEFVSSAALSGLHGFDSVRFSFRDSVLAGTEILFVAESGSLQVMTLLPGCAFVLVVAFLATAVALNAGLVGCPFRFRLGSLLLSFPRTFLGTWLAFGCVDLHLLQPIVVIFLGQNVPLDLVVCLALVVTTLLFQLHFENAGVNLNGEIGHILQS